MEAFLTGLGWALGVGSTIVGILFVIIVMESF